MFEPRMIPDDRYLPDRLRKQAAELVKLREAEQAASAEAHALADTSLDRDAQQADDSALLAAKDPGKVGTPAANTLRANRLRANAARDEAQAALRAAEQAWAEALDNASSELASIARSHAEQAAERYQASIKQVLDARAEYVSALREWHSAEHRDVELDYDREVQRLGITAAPPYTHPQWLDRAMPRTDNDVTYAGSSRFDTQRLAEVLERDSSRHVIRGSKPDHDPFELERFVN